MAVVINPKTHPLAWAKLQTNNLRKRNGLAPKEFVATDFSTPEAWQQYAKDNPALASSARSTNPSTTGINTGALRPVSSTGSGQTTRKEYQLPNGDTVTVQAAGGGFDLNPAPRSGNGPYGTVPGVLGLPDPYGDLSGVVPNLPRLNQSASDSILAKLNGELSPGTLNALKNAQATFGVSSGMPGSNLSWNSLFGNIAGAAESQQAQGLASYGPFVGAVSGTQTVNPELQAQIANQNAINSAAPDPSAAASEAQKLYNQYLNGIGGGTSGGGNSGGGGARNPGGGTMPSLNLPRLGATSPAPANTGPSSYSIPPATTVYDTPFNSSWNLPNYGDISAMNFVNPPMIFPNEFQGPPAPATDYKTATVAPYADNFWDEYNNWSF